MKNLPTSPYSGLTCILAHASRHDTEHLLSGIAGEWFETTCLKPLHTLSSIESRTCEDKSPLLPNTKYVALLGQSAIAAYDSKARVGYPMIANNQTKIYRAIGAYFPQDCQDIRQTEAEIDDDNEDTFTDSDTKDDYPTRRSNYAFWTRWHMQKLYKNPIAYPKIEPILYPSPEIISKYLNNITNEDLYLDIETSRQHQCITCIGISSTSLFPKVLVIPIYLYTGTIAYSNFINKIWRPIAGALLRNTAVIHNAMFDLLILNSFYRFPQPAKVYDTMLANHRLFPEVEKSLAHLIAMWTHERYHKDVATEVFTYETQVKMWNYNAKDVYTLKLIKDAQTEYCNKPTIHPSTRGLNESIAQANSAIIPYLRAQNVGMKLDRILQLETESQLALAKEQYIRIIRKLINIKDFNPASTKQCSKFFHDTLHYPVVKRGESGTPTLGRKQLYQLMLKHDNPCIPIIIKARKVAKDLSMLESELMTLI